MQVAKPVGRDAASRKYDILSALLAYALSRDKGEQRRVMRLMALITTRYNWQRDELSMGQAEIARLWSVDERTVKREMSALRASGWVVLKRRGARGRVSVHGLDLERMMHDTSSCWPHIGPDFVDRMTSGPKPKDDNVVPLRPVPEPEVGDTLWSQAQKILHATDPARYAAWLSPLIETDLAEGQLCLVAPSRFHARYVESHLKEELLRTLRMLDPSIAGLVLRQ